MNISDAAPTFFGPEEARSIALEAYATIGSTAVLIWDIILHLPEDYQQIRKQGFLKVSRVVYCCSRFTTLFYMIALCVVETAPIGNCAWIRNVAFVYPFTVPITILLFLFRIHALFRNKNYICTIVFLSWLLVFGSSIWEAFQTEGVNINGTEYCTEKVDARHVSDAVSTITRFFHDTLVFVVTSFWLYKVGDDSGSFTFGKRVIPLAWTRSLLHDGQAYYLATLILNVVVVALPFLSNPFVTPCTLGGPLFVLVSNMACHVYRNLVNAKYRDNVEFSRWEDGGWRNDHLEAGTWDATSPAGGSTV